MIYDLRFMIEDLGFGFDGECGCAYIMANAESRKKIFASDKRGGSVYSERVLLSGRQGCGQ
jgi:hypothetical protein